MWELRCTVEMAVLKMATATTPEQMEQVRRELGYVIKEIHMSRARDTEVQFLNLVQDFQSAVIEHLNNFEVCDR